jgi:aspartate racemase
VKSVGIVGGLGPESTIDYYRSILATWAREEPGTAPSIVIDSLDVQRGIRLIQGDRFGLVEYLLESLHRLARAGVDFAAMAANTPHVVYDELAARSPLPLLSIVEVCAEAAQRQGCGRSALLGTGFTMGEPFYPGVFARFGMTIVVPTADERAWLHARYLGELLQGDFRDETRAGVIAMIARMRDEDRIDSVILGGTELPLLLRSPAIANLPTLDTTTLHVEAIVRRLRSA